MVRRNPSGPFIGSEPHEIAEVQLMTLREAAELTARHGLNDLDLAWWRRACDRGAFPYATLANRRRVRRDRVEQMIRKAIEQA